MTACWLLSSYKTCVTRLMLPNSSREIPACVIDSKGILGAIIFENVHVGLAAVVSTCDIAILNNATP